jgi:hypothetical protein
MRWLFSLVLIAHGVIHSMGFLKAFGLAALPQLTQPISRPLGVGWLIAMVLMLSTAAALFAWPRGWWLIGAAALVVSQLVIVYAWRDARFGTIANAILLVGVAYGGVTRGPTSFRAAYDREVELGLARPVAAPVITEADLAPLPDPVQRYLRATGFVGQPRVHNYRVRFRGRIRGSADAAWMPFEVDQLSFGAPPARLFLMTATRSHLPVQALHRFVDGAATMRVRLAGVVPILDAHGPELDRSETVTLFNDMCVLAPGTLIDPAITWEPIDARSARARFTIGATTIAATLLFDADGLLRDFVSDDRSAASPDGKSFTRQRFTTPVRDYRRYGAVRLAAHGEARWHPPTGELSYGEFELVDIAYNVRAAR